MPDNHAFDADFDHYEKCYDHEWARQLGQVVEPTPIGPHFINLCEYWKSVGSVFRMPWLMLTNLEKFAAGFVQVSEVAEYAFKVAEHYADVLLAKVPNLEDHTKNDIRQAIDSTSAEFLVKAIFAGQKSRESYRFPIEEAWHDYLGNSDFLFAIVGTQRVCYGGLFYGYESYLKEMMILMTKKPEFRIGYKSIAGQMTALVGQAVADKCTDSTVRAAREVRNAFAHNGGKKTAELIETEKEFSQRGEDFPVQFVGDEIHIIAEDTQRLSVELKERVTLLTDAVLKVLAEKP